MPGIGLATQDAPGYQLPEGSDASSLNDGAQAVTQPPAAPGIGLATMPVAPPAPPDATPAPSPAPAPGAPPQPAPLTTHSQDTPLIDFHTNPLGAIGLVLSSAAAGFNGQESPVAKLKAQQLEQQAQQYRTAGLAMDVIDKTSAYVSKLPADQRGAAIADMDKRFSGALGGASISPFVTALANQSDKQRASTIGALQALSPSPAMLQYWSQNPDAAMKFLEDYQAHKATKDTPQEIQEDETARATGANLANATKPRTPQEITQDKQTAADAAETARHNRVQELADAKKAGLMSSDQANAATYADRAQEAEGVLSKTTDAQTSEVQHILADRFKSSDAQSAEQAKSDFLTAVLRREGGARVSPEELAIGQKQYFPQPGDKPAVIALKARNRATVINGLQRDAGPAYKAPAAVIQYDAQGNRIGGP